MQSELNFESLTSFIWKIKNKVVSSPTDAQQNASIAKLFWASEMNINRKNCLFIEYSKSIDYKVSNKGHCISLAI